MKNVFVFCASNRRARANFNKTVLKAIPDEVVYSSFPVEQHGLLGTWRNESGGFFAWGIKPGKNILTMLSSLQNGDCLLGFFDYHYRTISRLVGRIENPKFAQEMWGSDIWNNIIFMSKPREIAVPASNLRAYLSSTYRGAVRITTDKIERITNDFGSVDAFIEKHFN